MQKPKQAKDQQGQKRQIIVNKAKQRETNRGKTKKVGEHWVELCYYPFKTEPESGSDSAENFWVASFIYLKNILFYDLIFFLALSKSY